MRNFFAFTLGFILCSLAGHAAPSISQPGGTGGPASAVDQGVGYDGGGTWGVWIEGGNLTVSGGAGWFPDGGSIGTVAVENFPAVQPVSDNGSSLTVDGTVAVSSVGGSVAVTGTFWQATQPVSGTFWQATQPVSGTVTANQGTANSTANRWPVQLSDGTDSALVSAAGALQVDGSGVTQPVSGALTCNAGTGTFTVSGTVTSNAGTGTFTVAQATAANLHATVTDGSGALTVDGTVTANAGTGTFTVGGVAASDQPSSGNPVLAGVEAESDAAALASVSAEGDVVKLKGTLEGRLLVQDHHPLRFHAGSGLSTATTLTQIQAAPGAGVSLYVTDIIMSASVASTTTTDQQLTLEYGTGTNCGTGTTYLTGCFNQANGGCAINLRTPLKLPANTALCWMHAAAGSKIVSVTGYTAP